MRSLRQILNIRIYIPNLPPPNFLIGTKEIHLFFLHIYFKMTEFETTNDTSDETLVLYISLAAVEKLTIEKLIEWKIDWERLI